MMKRLMAVGLLLMMASAPALAGEGAKAATKSWFEKTSFKGDLRLRYEGFDQDDTFDDGRRDRFRYRFRWGFKAQVNEMITVGAQLRSGNADDPVSDNQSLDGGLSKKTISIAEAYADFKFSDRFSLIAGKFSPKKLWIVSDMHYDDDVVTEGAMARWTGKGDGIVKTLRGVAFAYVLEESKSDADSYIYGAQFGPTLKMGEASQLSFGMGYDSVVEPQGVADLTTSGKLDGNKMTNIVDESGRLVSDFDVFSLYAIWKCKSSKVWPVKVTAFYYQNSGASGAGKDYDTAYFARVQIGDYKKPGQMAFRASLYYSEPDALFYAFTQSDTTRSSNLNGLRFDYRLGLHSKGYLNFTWYQTDVEVGESATMDRWQVDYILKF